MSIIYDVKYEADVLPENADPPWTKTGYINSSIADGILKIIGVSLGGGGYTRKEEDFNYDFTKSFGIEFRAKIDPHYFLSSEAWLFLQDINSKSILLYLQDSSTGKKIILEGETTITITDIDVTAFHIYRLEISNNQCSLYVDENLLGDVNVGASISYYPFILFGSDIIYYSYWDYVRYGILGIENDITDSIAKQYELILNRVNEIKEGIELCENRIQSTEDVDVERDLLPSFDETIFLLEEKKLLDPLYYPSCCYLKNNWRGFDKYSEWIKRKISPEFAQIARRNFACAISSQNVYCPEIQLGEFEWTDENVIGWFTDGDSIDITLYSPQELTLVWLTENSEEEEIQVYLLGKNGENMETLIIPATAKEGDEFPLDDDLYYDVTDIRRIKETMGNGNKLKVIAKRKLNIGL